MANKESLTEQINKSISNEVLLSNILESAPDGMLIVGKGGIIIFANNQIENIFGYEKGELKNRPLRILIPNRFREKHDAHCVDYFDNPYARRMGKSRADLIGLRKDGTEFPIENALSTIPVDQETIALSIIRDITDRKKTEETLISTQEKLKLVVSNTPIVLFAIDKDGKFTLSEGKGLIELGLKPGEVVGASAFEIYKDVPQIITDIKRALQGDELTDTVEVAERTFHTHYIPLKTDNRNSGTVGVSVDITQLKQAEKNLEESYKKLEKTLEGTVAVLADTVEKRDAYTSGHQKQVAKLSAAIAEEIGLSKEQTKGVYIAGLIHDIGKIAVPLEILSKPGKISDTEFEIIKTHPKVAFDILKNVDFPWPIAEAAYQHLEREDGSGYPRGLNKDQIIIEAKIIAVADVVEAMASHRPYRPALGIDAALLEIIKDKDKLYNSQIVDTCLKLFKEKGFKFSD